MQKQSQLAVRRFLERARQQLRSQDELAEVVSRLGYPLKRSAIGHWLTGHTQRVPAWVIFALAEELRLPLNEFIAGQSWDDRLTAVEVQLAFLIDRLPTEEKQAITRQMTSHPPEV